MGLFKKDKNSFELNQTNQIKEAATMPLPPINLDDKIENNNNNNNNSDNLNSNLNDNLSLKKESSQVENSDFINPFANQSLNQTNTNVNQNNNLENLQSSKENINAQNNNNNNNINNPSNSNKNLEKNFEKQNLNQANNLNLNSNFNKEEFQDLIDETVEKIIEEKWNSLIEKVEIILRWKDEKESQIDMLKTSILNIGESFSKLESKLINKITSYDKNILDVNSEIKALEKVFQKITPTLVNNVNELSNIASDLKSNFDNKKKN